MSKNTEVVLRAEVENLGHAGDVVEVAPGYARNYLLPQRLAYVAITRAQLRLLWVWRNRLARPSEPLSVRDLDAAPVDFGLVAEDANEDE